MPVLIAILSRRARLYTEMPCRPRVLHGTAPACCALMRRSIPSPCNSAGPSFAAAEGAKIGADLAMTKSISISVCPSERVKSGAFGACLNARAGAVGDCVAAMKARVEIPVTVSAARVSTTRPGSGAWLLAERVVSAGCDALIVMQGSDAERLVAKGEPRRAAADYGLVHALKQRFPCPVELNGGLRARPDARRA